MTETDVAHENYVNACNSRYTSDRYFAKYMYENDFTNVNIYFGALEETKESVKSEMTRAFEHLCNLEGRGTAEWVYNYAKSFYTPLEQLGVSQEERDEETDKFVSLYMKWIMS
eukprot:TRINITY_DN1521_c0_g1_i4.p4 TRINITY_DN1521_c0_g1~~TRINITY_DN1521_c0_g1_i4.p4  ORF type:complete len:113 (+),score=10.56 TRINITY_DN1521_c0_g1_i4:52-390(+)